jgi:N-acyl-D-aspartate/D-glutamate deacylase
VYALASCQPPISRHNFVSGFGLDNFPGWAALFRLSISERREALAHPIVSRWLEEGAATATGILQSMNNWSAWTIQETFSDRFKPYEGKTIGELGRAIGKRPFEAMVEIVLADDLRTSLMPPTPGADSDSWLLRGQAWLDARTVIGASDAGAHLDMLSTFSFTTTVLGEGVRRRKLLTLEQAVRQLTGIPADYLGLRGRGNVALGMLADLVIFDPELVDCGPVHTRFDLPAGAGRLYAEPQGIGHVIVNGVEIIRDGSFLGRYAGQIIRSGKDTRTVSIPAKLA